MSQVALLCLPPPSDNPEEAPHSCEWKMSKSQGGDHEFKCHLKKVEYSKKGDGKADRDDGAPKRWKDTDKRVPWLWPSENEGTNSLHLDEEYHINRHSPASSYSYPEYATEGHHLISCDLFSEDNYPALVPNALLVGYDVNHKNNGYHVPAFIVDIVCHDIQHHASSHSWSDPAPLEYDLDEKIAPYLSNLEENSLDYCRADPQGDGEYQQKLINDLNRISSIIMRRIKNWDYFLTKLAKMKLGDLGRYGKKVDKPRGIYVKDKNGNKVRYESGGDFLIKSDLKQYVLAKKNLMPSGFPNWDYYISEGLRALENGESPNQPFSRWISIKMLKEKRRAPVADD